MGTRENEYIAYWNGLGAAMVVSLLFFTFGALLGREFPLFGAMLFVCLGGFWGTFMKSRFGDIMTRKPWIKITLFFKACLILCMLNMIFLLLMQFHLIHLPS
jgi:hypothetical protein